MSDQLSLARIAMIEAIKVATLENRLEWIRTNPDEVKWKTDTIEQRYAMLSQDGIFVTLSRQKDGSLELMVQVQETGCYREYEISKSDGLETTELLQELYKALPSTAKMMEDFLMIADELKSSKEI